MTENKGDLISREALKTNIDKFIGYLDEDMICRIKVVIDNAPTVKTFTLEDIEEQYRKGLEKGLSEWETERPQSEWVGGDKVITYGNLAVSGCWHCKRCGALRGVDANFCGKCGAEMVGGES